MASDKTKTLNSIQQATDFILSSLDREVFLATPLGLGKPNLLINSLYEILSKDPSKTFKIFTALSLGMPEVKEDLGKRFFAPFAERQWGNNYPTLKYFAEAAKDQQPKNISVHEFYFQAGAAQSSNHLQRNFQSVNYTHAAQNVFLSGVNVIVQLIASRIENGKTEYSFSCNPDITADVVKFYEQAGKKILLVGVVHPDLPFLAGDALVEDGFFDAVVHSDEMNYELFALPRMPIPVEDHLIGLYASQLVKDGGTIQIGIGSLSDAIVCSLKKRHSENAKYQSMVKSLQPVQEAHFEIFTQGLYGLTEMLTDGFMHLRNAGILKREVGEENGNKTYLHGSFILGSKDLYKWLRELKTQDAQGLRMTPVSKVNDLYDPHETLLRQQRVHPRFFNTTMQVSLLGEAMSETLPDGTVISGVGGQYNFVAMSRELKDSLSVLMLRSWRLDHQGQRVSNIVWTPGHVTIPRHLRDVVVTEYGVAFIKGKSDEECIKLLLQITDSQFQNSLVAMAIKAGKLEKDYSIPQEFTHNTPEKIKQLTSDPEFKKTFLPFPFGSDFTQEEEKLALALDKIQKAKKVSSFNLLLKAFTKSVDAAKYMPELRRMNLAEAGTVKEKIYRKILLAYLDEK